MIPDGGTYYCADYKMNVTTCTLGKECNMTITATSTLTKEYSDTCRCKWDGTPMCRLDSSSTQWKNFVDTYNAAIKELSEAERNNIHVVLQRGNWWNITKIQNAYAEYGQYLEINGTQDCVKSYYLTGMTSEECFIKYSLVGLVSLVYLLL